jgi:hypothetical protein
MHGNIQLIVYIAWHTLRVKSEQHWSSPILSRYIVEMELCEFKWRECEWMFEHSVLDPRKFVGSIQRMILFTNLVSFTFHTICLKTVHPYSALNASSTKDTFRYIITQLSSFGCSWEFQLFVFSLFLYWIFFTRSIHQHFIFCGKSNNGAITW